jgi:hypothetical protein
LGLAALEFFVSFASALHEPGSFARCRYGGTASLCKLLKEEKFMTNRIGNKDVAQHRSKQEKKRIYQDNVALEAEKKAIARAKYRNAVKNHPGAIAFPN